jgi:hypothetical protein
MPGPILIEIDTRSFRKPNLYLDASTALGASSEPIGYCRGYHSQPTLPSKVISQAKYHMTPCLICLGGSMPEQASFECVNLQIDCRLFQMGRIRFLYDDLCTTSRRDI